MVWFLCRELGLLLLVLLTLQHRQLNHSLTIPNKTDETLTPRDMYIWGGGGGAENKEKEKETDRRVKLGEIGERKN